MTTAPDGPASRSLVYGLLIATAVGLSLGRLASLERVNEPSVHKPDGDKRPRPAWPKTRPDPWPTFGSNDRSRWATVRALVENGTFVVGRRDAQKRDTGIVFEDGFQTVDKVMNPETREFYSTKPPLLTVIAAGEYWVMNRVFGLSIVADRWLVIPFILITLNIVPFVLYLALLAWLAERFGTTDWAKFYIVAAGGFATMVTPFLITFNNHTIATAGVALALYAVICILDAEARATKPAPVTEPVRPEPTPKSWGEGARGRKTNPLMDPEPAPAPEPRPPVEADEPARPAGMGWFVLAGLTAGFTACNELPAAALAAGLAVYLLWRCPVRTLALFVPAALVPVAVMLALNVWQFGDWQPAYAKFGTQWYTYEGSHWLPAGQTKPGIDYAGRNGETKPSYAFHLLLGHHGWFSLTPIMFLGLAGMLVQSWRSDPDRKLFRCLALFSLIVSAVVIGYYIAKTDNYGGWTNGARWLMWLSPLWLVCMLPVLDRLAPSRGGRLLALTLLVVSILAMSYQLWNPWRHPWIYAWMEWRGWIAY